MAKDWWFKFDFKLWRTDSKLRRCSLETRGFWLECICAMRESDSFELHGSYEELGWLIGCSPEVVARCALELHRTDAAHVTLGNGEVTLVSRYIKKEDKTKRLTRLRVAKHRGNADVTPVQRDRVISNKKEVNKERENAGAWAFPLRELFTAFPDLQLTPAQVGMIEAKVQANNPAHGQAWKRTILKYVANHNRATNSYLPEKVGNLLSVFDEELDRLEKKNGTNKQAGGFGPKRTDADVIAESTAFYENYPS